MKIAFDENTPTVLVEVFRTFASVRQLKRKIGVFEVKSAKDYTPQRGDHDYIAKNDVPWIKRFAADGGKVIISGNTDMRYVPHERLALIQAGMLVFFFDPKWNNWDFFLKCSLLLYHWPAIARRIKTARAPAFWHIPLSWHPKAKIRKTSTDDPKTLKLERRNKPSKPPKKKAVAIKASPPRERDLLDLMNLEDQNGNAKKARKK